MCLNFLSALTAVCEIPFLEVELLTWGYESLSGAEAGNKSLLKEGLPEHVTQTERGGGPLSARWPILMMIDFQIYASKRQTAASLMFQSAGLNYS